jgi:hypothetical protein
MPLLIREPTRAMLRQSAIQVASLRLATRCCFTEAGGRTGAHMMEHDPEQVQVRGAEARQGVCDSSRCDEIPSIFSA